MNLKRSKPLYKYDGEISSVLSFDCWSFAELTEKDENDPACIIQNQEFILSASSNEDFMKTLLTNQDVLNAVKASEWIQAQAPEQFKFFLPNLSPELVESMWGMAKPMLTGKDPEIMKELIEEIKLPEVILSSTLNAENLVQMTSFDGPIEECHIYEPKKIMVFEKRDSCSDYPCGAGECKDQCEPEQAMQFRAMTRVMRPAPTVCCECDMNASYDENLKLCVPNEPLPEPNPAPGILLTSISLMQVFHSIFRATVGRRSCLHIYMPRWEMCLAI